MINRPSLISTHLAHYDSAYKRFSGEYHPAASLVGLIELCQKRWNQNFFKGSWLEMGCGVGSTFEALKSGKPDEIIACDFSSIACDKAQARHIPDIQFEVARLSSPWPAQWPLFDGVLDAHMLHCLRDREEVHSTLKYVFENLKEGGALVAEVMVGSKRFFPDQDLFYEAESGKLTNRQGLVVHLILNAYDWEQLILESGLSLFYFEVYSHLRFIHNPKRDDLGPCDPEVLRFIAIKPEGES